MTTSKASNRKTVNTYRPNSNTRTTATRTATIMETSGESYEHAVHEALSKLQECQICHNIQRKVCIPCSHIICTDCAQKCNKNKLIECPYKCGFQTLPTGGCREVATLNEFSDFLMVTSSNVRKCIRHIFCESRYTPPSTCRTTFSK